MAASAGLRRSGGAVPASGGSEGGIFSLGGVDHERELKRRAQRAAQRRASVIDSDAEGDGDGDGDGVGMGGGMGVGPVSGWG